MANRTYKAFLPTLLVAIVTFAPIARGAVKIWSITPILLAEAAMILIWFLKIVNVEKYQLKKTSADMPILLLALLSVISFSFSRYKYESLYELIKLFGYIGVYYIVINEFNYRTKRLLRNFLISFGAGLSAYGLLQYFGIFSHPWWVPKDFLAATYVNHNHFAGYLELIIPLAVATFMAARPRLAARLALSVALVVMASAFVLTQSRGAWISLSVSLFVMAILLGRDKSRRARTVLTLLLLAASILSFIYFSKDLISQRLEPVTTAASDEASFATRIAIWKGTIRMIRDHPIIGTGIGTFISVFPRYRPEGLNVIANFAHNDYLNVAAEIGIPALLVMIWLLIMAIRSGLKRGTNDTVKLGCAIGILSLSLHSLVDFNFHIPANMLLFTIYVAFIMSGRAHAKE